MLQFIFLAILIICITIYIFIKQISTPYPEIVRFRTENFYVNKLKGEKVPFPSLTEKPVLNLSVIVPAYNEEIRLPPMLDETINYLEERILLSENKFKYEVIIVSDGSTDKTVPVALTYTEKYGADKIRVLKLVKNRGKGGAVRLGVQSCRGAEILFADADGATKFSDLSKLEVCLKNLIEVENLLNIDKTAEQLGFICGSRAHLEKESTVTRSIFRTFLMYAFHFVVWLFAVRSVRDTQCGFKLFTRRTAEILFTSLHVEKWAFDVELIYMAEKLKIPIKEVNVNWTEIEGSKIVPVFSWLQMGLDILLIWFRYQTGCWKIK